MSVLNGIMDDDRSFADFSATCQYGHHQGWHLTFPAVRHISPRLQLEPLTAREKSVLVLRCPGLEGVLGKTAFKGYVVMVGSTHFFDCVIIIIIIIKYSLGWLTTIVTLELGVLFIMPILPPFSEGSRVDGRAGRSVAW